MAMHKPSAAATTLYLKLQKLFGTDYAVKSYVRLHDVAGQIRLDKRINEAKQAIDTRTNKARWLLARDELTRHAIKYGRHNPRPCKSFDELLKAYGFEYV